MVWRPYGNCEKSIVLPFVDYTIIVDVATNDSPLLMDEYPKPIRNIVTREWKNCEFYTS